MELSRLGGLHASLVARFTAISQSLQVLIHKPLLLLADEPTGALDSSNAENVMQIFESLRSNERAVVLVTHDQGVAGRADRKVSMRDGEIVADEYKVLS